MTRSRTALAVILAALAACGPDQAAPAGTLAGAPVSGALANNSSVVNGDFEAGDLSVGWTTGGTQNNTESRVLIGSNHVGRIDVGDGPHEAGCTDPDFDNFGYLDQLFQTVPGGIELDYLVPPPTSDPTEDASCSGFDRVEIDFDVVVPDPFSFQLTSAVLIDYSPEVGQVTGILVVNDSVTGASWFAQFDPSSSAPVSAGPLSIAPSGALSGWVHAKLDLNTTDFPWLPSAFVGRVTARVEDNGNTGQQFSVSIDNVTSAAPAARTVVIDIKPGSSINPFNCAEARPLLPVAILSTADFDATTVDASTVRFGRTGDEAAAVNGAHVEDVNGDGLADLMLQFRTGDTGLTCADQAGVLTGKTAAGVAITGTDTLTPVPGR